MIRGLSKTGLALLVMLCAASPALAQAVIFTRTSGTITTSGSSCSTTTNCVVLAGTARTANGTIVLGGSFTGTAQFEGTVSDETLQVESRTWFSLNVQPQGSTSFVTSATAAGQWIQPLALTGVRVRASALSSGSITVSILATSARGPGGGGGGGGSGTINTGATNAIPKYVGSTTLDDSLCTDDGTTLTCTGTGGASFDHLTTTGTASTSSLTAITAPGTPASGVINWYGDSTLKQLCTKNDAATVACLSSTLARGLCAIVVGADNGSALADADLGPQNDQCLFPQASTIQEIIVKADAGTPNVIVRKTSVANSHTALLSSALATAGSGARACSKTAAVAGIDATTTCSATLQNNTLAIGETVGLASGTAGGTAKRLSVFVYFTRD